MLNSSFNWMFDLILEALDMCVCWKEFCVIVNKIYLHSQKIEIISIVDVNDVFSSLIPSFHSIVLTNLADRF